MDDKHKYNIIMIYQNYKFKLINILLFYLSMILLKFNFLNNNKKYFYLNIYKISDS